MVSEVFSNFESMQRLKKETLTGIDAPAVYFGTLDWQTESEIELDRSVSITNSAVPERPKTDDELAFLPVTELSNLIRSRKVTSVELTKPRT